MSGLVRTPGSRRGSRRGGGTGPRLAAAALAGGAVLACAACGDNGGGAAPSTVVETHGVTITSTAPEPTHSATSSPRSSTRSSTSASSPASPTATTNADGQPVPAADKLCRSESLDVSATSGDAGAGSLYYTIELRNTGSRTCELAGFPGVSAVDSRGGDQIGAPAGRSGERSELVTLGKGDSATASLRVVNVGTGGGPIEGCDPETAAGLLVYPPGLEEAQFVSVKNLHACGSDTPFMTVSPVRAG